MKKSIVFLVILTLGILSCAKPDPCEEIVCQNGGTCSDGTCNCPEGFAGTLCETALLPKAVNVSSIKVLKIPAIAADGKAWDEDGSGGDIFPALATLKADNTVDKYLWLSEFRKTNAPTDQPYTFNTILPELSMTIFDEKLVFLLIDKDDSSTEQMGGITFTLKNLIKDKPAKITLDCDTCKVGFELTVSYK
jgi:hypothetical protein